jgi:hypothetical protein
MDLQLNTAFKELFTSVLEKNLDKEAFLWLKDKASHAGNMQFNMAFASVPRKAGKKEIVIEHSNMEKAEELLPGFSIRGWSVARLCRVWLLMHLDSKDKNDYIKKINDLFSFGDMNELVALYSSLIFFTYPEEWVFRCSEGIRNNIGAVQEAVMYHNPFPSKYLDEPLWNQLVMKAFFGDKDVRKISGLDERANKNLSRIIFDYIEERWAAHRMVNPQLWRLVGRYIDESNFYLIEKLFRDNNIVNRRAAAMAALDSSYGPARLLLHNYPELEKEIHNSPLDWNELSDQQ